MGNKKVIVFSVITILLFSIASTGYSIYQTYKAQQMQNQLKELFLLDSTTDEAMRSCVINANSQYLQNYITNQKFLLDNWWNTIINQSGLSIIITLIVLLITITVGMFNKSEIQEKIDNEIEILKHQNMETLKDVSMVLSTHKGSFGTVLYDMDDYYQNNANKINSFSMLKILRKEDFYNLYDEDIEERVRYIKNLYEADQQKNHKMIEEMISPLTNKDDRKKILENTVLAIRAKRIEYPEPNKEDRIIKDEETINYILSLG